MIGEELAKERESQGETRSHQSHRSRKKGVSEGGAQSVMLLRKTRKIKIERSLFNLTTWISCVALA